MDTTAAPRRRADAARNDELLLDAGLRLLREKGPDRLTALDVARQAGLTTGAVYARYENNEELLVGLWQKRLLTPLQEYLADAVQVFMATGADDISDSPMDDPVRRVLMDPDSPLLAAISLLIAAPRISELSEVVIPDIQGILRDLGVSEDREDARSLQILGAVSTGIGCLYFAAADMFQLDEWPVIRSMTRYICGRRVFERYAPVEPTEPFQYVIDTGDATRDALVNAAARVIARSGIERATTQRVARAANLPPSALFAEYQNRQTLFADVAAKLLREIYQEYRYRALYGQSEMGSGVKVPLSGWDDPRLQGFRHSMTTNIASNTTGLLAPLGREHRRIRLEFQLAAMHNPDIRSELQRVDESTNRLSADLQRSMFNFPTAIAGPGTRISRTIAQGAMLLEEVSSMVQGRDFRIINGPLADYCCLVALGLPTVPTPEAPHPR